MSDISKSEKSIKQLFVGNCWSYLNDNFHKFSETNKIKIALELCKKDIPQEFDGTMKQIVLMENIKKDGTNFDIKIG